MDRLKIIIIILACIAVITAGCGKSSSNSGGTSPGATNTPAATGTQVPTAISVSGSWATSTPVTTTYNVTGTLTLPAAAPGRPWEIIFSPDNNFEFSTMVVMDGLCGANSTINFQANIAPGAYYMVAAVGIFSNLAISPTTGDYFGVYGGTWPSYWPSSANLAAPASGWANANITLVTANPNISGTLTLPQAEAGKQFMVIAMTGITGVNSTPPPQSVMGYVVGICGSSTTVSYTGLCFRPGPTYFGSVVDALGTGVLNVVGEDVPAGDFAGIYGDTNPYAAPTPVPSTVSVPNINTMTTGINMTTVTAP